MTTTPSPWSVVVVGLNRQDVQHAEDEALAVAATVRNYGLCQNPILCVGPDGASKAQIRNALKESASSPVSKLLFFFAGHGQSYEGGMTLLEPADAPETAEDQEDDVSSWVVLEDEVWCAVNGRGFRNKTVVTILAICREQCIALSESLPPYTMDPLPSHDESITFCDVYLCKHGEMLNDYQYFASAFDFYMSLGTPDLHSLLSRMKEDLYHLTVGKVSLQFGPVDTVVRLVAGRSFEDPRRILQEDEFEALRRPVFLSRYLEKLASNLDATEPRGLRMPFAAMSWLPYTALTALP